MAGPLPLDPHGALREAAHASRHRGRDHGHTSFPWGRLLVFLIAAGAFSWSFYDYYWQYQLPRTKVLTDRDGKKLNVHIDEDDGGVLKLTSLTDGSTQLEPVSFLSQADQTYFAKVSPKPSLSFPQPAHVRLGNGNWIPVSVKAGNRFFVEYSILADSSTHYAAISDLTEFDQALIATMDKSLKVAFPMDYTLADAAGNKTPVHIIGRSENLIRFSSLTDNKIHVRLISSLTPDEQLMINSFDPNEVDAFPVEMTLTTKTGDTLPVTIINRDSSDIIYYIPSENDVKFLHRYPISELSPELQRPAQSIYADASAIIDDTCALTDKSGHTLVVKIMSRSNDMVKFVVQNDNKTYIYPISNLSGLDQTYVNSLDKSLTDDWDLPQLTVTVQIARAQLIDLDKKITNLQNELTRPGISEGDMDGFKQQIADYQSEENHYITQIQNDFEKRIDTLNTQNVELEGKIRDSNYSKDEKILMQNQILKNNDMATLLKTEEDTVTQTGDSVKSLVN